MAGWIYALVMLNYAFIVAVFVVKAIQLCPPDRCIDASRTVEVSASIAAEAGQMGTTEATIAHVEPVVAPSPAIAPPPRAVIGPAAPPDGLVFPGEPGGGPSTLFSA